MEVSRATRLAAFVERFANAPIEWGKSDCTATPALWLSEECGFALPGCYYQSEAEAHAILEDRGGLLAIWDEWLGEHGVFERIGPPQLGDVAIIDTRTKGHIGGICAEGRVLLIRTDRNGEGGMTFFGPVRSFVKVWATP